MIEYKITFFSFYMKYYIYGYFYLCLKIYMNFYILAHGEAIQILGTFKKNFLYYKEKIRFRISIYIIGKIRKQKPKQMILIIN
jgi:hypothetical protein